MDNLISLPQAVAMTTLYRAEKDNIVKPEYAGQNLLPICETFGRAAFDKVLAQPDCVKMRIYYGMSDDLKLHAIIVGVNSEDEDILPPASSAASAASVASADDGDDDGNIIEEGVSCPPLCPPSSPLNP